MAARAISSTTISFGLVSVPVKLYSTGESAARVSFNMLHGKCGTRLKQQYICPKDEAVVAREDIAKGYEFAKDQYVIFTEDELKKVEAPKGESIEITEFVPAETVDRIYFDRAYYLGPDKGGARAYRLLAAALKETGRVAIGKYATRGRQYLVMVRPHEAILVMEQLRYAEEVRPASEVPVEDGEVKRQELQLAVQLIEQLASDEFRPQSYKDEVREQMLELIQQKVEGQEITVAPAEEPQVQIIDLMAALKASLSEGAARKPAARAGKRPAAAPKAAATAKTTSARKASPSRKKASSG
ncbi:MAG: Ku protein [Gemmatimonadetes bacterium]|nr:Ku protein [Gemmatimonadota bacterium]